MVRANPNTAGRFFHYQQLRPEQREEMAHTRHDKYDARLERNGSRPIHPEKGMLLDEMPNPRVKEIAEEQGWMQFVRQPGAYDANIVKEFYAALIPASFNSFHTVLVQNRVVHLSPEIIRTHYGAQHHPHLEETHGVSRIPGVTEADHYSRLIAATLRRSGREHWAVRSDEIKKSELYPEIGVWLRFVKSNLAVSSHYTNADTYVARILYCLQTNLPIDIGMIIKQHILFAASERATGILPFPCLITRICEDAGINVNPTEIPGAPFDKVTYKAQLTAARILDGQDTLSLERMRIPANVDDDEAEDSDYEPEPEETRQRASRRRKAPRPTDFESLARFIEEQKEEVMEAVRDLRKDMNAGFKRLENLYKRNTGAQSTVQVATPPQPQAAQPENPPRLQTTRRVRGRGASGASSSRSRPRKE